MDNEFKLKTAYSKIAVVIPCYKVKATIESVINKVPQYIALIYCIDDKCPERSGDFIEEKYRNEERVKVLRHTQNKGVGGAVMSGYKKALEDKANIVIKIDGDGQMYPELIPSFIMPILNGECDYTKGTRFYHLEDLKPMPIIRKIGNGILSFFSKFSTGYWNITDPTNGYTAIETTVLKHLPLQKISERFFFETDMLFRLNVIRSVVVDIPIKSVYKGEKSNLKVHKVVLPFLIGHFKNFYKRIIYNFFIRDFNVATLNLIMGTLLFVSGGIFGIIKFYESIMHKVIATPGTVMLSALPILIGWQMLIVALQFDMQNVPQRPLHKSLKNLQVNFP